MNSRAPYIGVIQRCLILRPGFKIAIARRILVECECAISPNRNKADRGTGRISRRGITGEVGRYVERIRSASVDAVVKITHEERGERVIWSVTVAIYLETRIIKKLRFVGGSRHSR